MSHSEAGQAASVRRVLAVIPARGGSKGVPAQEPRRRSAACRWSPAPCASASRPALVTDVVVSTDDPAIAAAAREAGAEVVLRPAAIAGDTATSEAAVLHAMDAYEAMHGRRSTWCCWSSAPARSSSARTSTASPRAVVEDGADTRADRGPLPRLRLARRRRRPRARSAPSAPPSRAARTPLVTGTATSGGYGVNHDKSFRPRRQDRPQDLLETGAAYAMDAPRLPRAQAPLLRPHRAGPHRPRPGAGDRRPARPGPRPRPRAAASTRTGPAPSRPPTTSTRSSSTSTAPRPTTGC